jgi:signal transduction histidine kinase
MIFLQANSEVLFIITITVAMLLVIVFFSVYLFFLFQKRKIHLLQQQQLMKENYEQEILKTQIEIRDQAMNDVGRELHDHISQVMTLIKINMNLLAGNGLDAANEQRLDDTKNMMKEAISDIRMLSKTLNGDLIQQIGLVDSIKHELERINRLNLIECTLEVTGEQYPIPANTSFVVFRIVQENLHNILKHAQCKNVSTVLIYTPGSLTLSQHDDGIGFDTAAINIHNTGSGLLNMQRRAKMIGADLQLSSAAATGTTLQLVINNCRYESWRP